MIWGSIGGNKAYANPSTGLVRLLDDESKMGPGTATKTPSVHPGSSISGGLFIVSPDESFTTVPGKGYLGNGDFIAEGLSDLHGQQSTMAYAEFKMKYRNEIDLGDSGSVIMHSGYIYKPGETDIRDQLIEELDALNVNYTNDRVDNPDHEMNGCPMITFNVIRSRNADQLFADKYDGYGNESTPSAGNEGPGL